MWKSWPPPSNLFCCFARSVASHVTNNALKDLLPSYIPFCMGKFFKTVVTIAVIICVTGYI